MKKLIILCSTIPLLTAFSCKTENKKNDKQTVNSEQTSRRKTTEKPSDKEKTEEIDWLEYSNLVPIEIKNSDSKNVFQKYGTEFTGNCYACDLAYIKINKKNFDLVNVCDENDFKRFKEFSYNKTGNKFIIKTSETTFILTKVEDESIFRLSIEGKKPEFKNKRLSEFYTPKNLIEKFEEHDCGDFQG